MFAVSIALLAALATAGCNDALAPSTGNTPAAKPRVVDGDALRDRIDRVLRYTLAHRKLDVHTNAAWQVVHGALAFGRDFQVLVDGKAVGAIDYLLAGGALNGWTLRPGERGLDAVLEAGTKHGQGHEDQWLGYLSQAGLKPEDKVVAAGKPYTIADMISQAQWDLQENMEATWTLMALATFLPLDAKWQAQDGSEWTIDRIAGIESQQELATSACGGSHRLYGLTVARNRCRDSGQPLSAGFKQADEKIAQAIGKAREYQQPDGTFSVNYFERPGSSPDLTERLGTTGHTLEFLSLALDKQQLAEPWMVRAANALALLFEQTQDESLECGKLFHAAHGLKLYRERRFGPQQSPADSSAPPDAPPSPATAKVPGTSASPR